MDETEGAREKEDAPTPAPAEAPADAPTPAPVEAPAAAASALAPAPEEEAPTAAPEKASAAAALAAVPEEEAGDGFQLVTHDKKKKRASGQEGGASGPASPAASAGSDAARASAPASPSALTRAAAKGKVPFHDPSIPRPQDVYKIIVDNFTPFDHVWLERSEDGTRPVHPLENLSVGQFVDRNVTESEPVKPAELEDTPFTLVEDQKGLVELAKKLRSVTEFAVDLEHNQYRSFQGLTCLMQISTRTEDFVVDTLKLRIYIGLYLKELFKDPTKRKVMHGADRDIMWLQRDFHIYVCNLFDTGQASRVLQMERNSLEYLLQHFCGVTAKKEYQNADWRSRPLSDEMIKYAREDTHYLLYIYDLMRQRLQRESTPENDLLLEVYMRSNEICLQFYEKEQLTETSYLHIYGLLEQELNAEQLAIVSALHDWRDFIARQEDESTGYILPNRLVLEIAKQMPTDTGHLKRIVKSKYPFVESSLEEIVGIVWDARNYSYAYEQVAEKLRKVRLEQLASESDQASNEMTPSDAGIGRSNSDPTNQSSVAPSSTASVNVASGSGAGLMSETALFRNIHLGDKTQTISSSETRTSQTLSGLSRPMNKQVPGMDRYQQARSNADNFKPSVLPFVPTESLYPNPGMYGDNFWGQSIQMNEMMQMGNMAYYPQFPGYSSDVVGSHYEHGIMQMSGYYPSGFDPSFQSTSQRSIGTRQSDPSFQSTNQRSTGTGQFDPSFQSTSQRRTGTRQFDPSFQSTSQRSTGTRQFDPSFQPTNQRSTGTRQPPDRSRQGSFQRRQSFPPSGNRYDRTYQ